MAMTLIKKILRILLPRKLSRFIRYLIIRKDIARKNEQYHAKLKELKTKDKITVIFFVIHSSVWKYDGLYELLEEDSIFNPLIVVCPYLNVSEREMLHEMEKTYSLFEEKNYNVIKSFNGKENRWVDPDKEFNPDIIFYSVPYTYTREEYQYTFYNYVLNCYVPYFFVTNGNNEGNYDSLFHNMMWKAFYETEIHKSIAKKYARNKAENVVVSGYPGLDHYLFDNINEYDPWKIKNKSIKRIIWAPHHTIEGQGTRLNYSNFQKYHDFFIEILNKYEGKVQIAFKPHPLLREKLYKDESWGTAKTDNYYKFWDEQSNSILCESEYVDLFLTSDALIHDCSSFMAEYLSTKKPILYLLRDNRVPNRLNEFGEMALEHHYQASNEGEIKSFIENLINDEDPQRNSRFKFVEKQLMPPNNRTASENIYHELKSFISNG